LTSTILFTYRIQLKLNHFSNYYYYTVNDVNPPASPVSELRLGKMHLVDLAGSERVALSGAEGDTLLETQSINLSLTAIGSLKLIELMFLNPIIINKLERKIPLLSVYQLFNWYCNFLICLLVMYFNR
jgi:Kinesin motor domain